MPRPRCHSRGRCPARSEATPAQGTTSAVCTNRTRSTRRPSALFVAAALLCPTRGRHVRWRRTHKPSQATCVPNYSPGSTRSPTRTDEADACGGLRGVRGGSVAACIPPLDDPRLGCQKAGLIPLVRQVLRSSELWRHGALARLEDGHDVRVVDRGGGTRAGHRRPRCVGRGLIWTRRPEDEAHAYDASARPCAACDTLSASP